MKNKIFTSNNFFTLLLALVLLFFITWLYNGTSNMRYAGVRYVPIEKTYDVVAFGDSLVEGLGAKPDADFVSLLEDRLDISILNLGRRGDTTYSALFRVDQVLTFNPKVVLVLFGGNDVLHGITIDKRLENLSILIDKIESSGAQVLLLGVRSGVWQDRYQKDFISLASKKDILYIPDVLENVLFNPALLFDPIHPNNKGHELIADRVEPALRLLLGK